MPKVAEGALKPGPRPQSLLRSLRFSVTRKFSWLISSPLSCQTQQGSQVSKVSISSSGRNKEESESTPIIEQKESSPVPSFLPDKVPSGPAG